jgi:UDP-N-acetyl-D-glucosamine dehydrogenase
VAATLRPGQLVCLESTTYPGTTDEVVLPRLEACGLRVGQDFFLAFSPEREDSGDTQFDTATIPKVVGGVTPECLDLATPPPGGSCACERSARRACRALIRRARA